MTRPVTTEVIEELASLYLAGAMPADDRAGFERQLAAGWPEAETALRNLSDAVRALAGGVPPVAPAPGARVALLAAVDPRATDRAAAAHISGILFRFAEDEAFAPTPHPGLTIRVLAVDHVRGQFTAFLKLAPGTRYPAHHHGGTEECLVLAGEIVVGGMRLRAGDYQRAGPGSHHADQWSETGAILYLTAPLSLLE